MILLEDLARMFNVTELKMFKILASLNVHEYVNSRDDVKYEVEAKALCYLRKDLKRFFSKIPEEELQKKIYFILENIESDAILLTDKIEELQKIKRK